MKHPVELDKTLGHQLYSLIEALYPLCRSITGDGLRESLALIKQHIPLTLYEVPSGASVFDWVVPKEWTIKDAYVKNQFGQKVIDFKQSNLHLVNYSVPIHTKLSLDELRPHLHTLPEHPSWIPYRTSYYKESWGFCLSHEALEALEPGEYEVLIDSKLEEGSLTYGEYFIQGETDDEVLLHTHCCHPSLCNDNLSGMSVLTFLAKTLSAMKLKFSYRFIFTPGTIGAITWLSQNESKLKHLKHGLVVGLVGDKGAFTYKKSRRGNAKIDKVVEFVIKRSEKPYKIVDFSPYGYDERQYCSPGFNLPMGRFTRSANGQYPEYHTSADNLDFVTPSALEESYSLLLSIINTLEHNENFVNTNPKCEPQLGKRGLYEGLGGSRHKKELEMALLWVLNLSDGEHSLLDIALKAQMDFEIIVEAAALLKKAGLLTHS